MYMIYEKVICMWCESKTIQPNTVESYLLGGIYLESHCIQY